MREVQLSEHRDLLCGIPQSLVLGLLLFFLYTADVIAIAESYDIQVHCYANDVQLYVHCVVNNIEDATRQLIACIAYINNWMSSNQLKLNPGKMQ